MDSAPVHLDSNVQRPSKALRWARRIGAVVAGVSWPGAILLVGWISAWMRRAQGMWWARQCGPDAWAALTRQHREWESLRDGVTWFRDPVSTKGWWSKNLGMLRTHGVRGATMLACTWALTLPGLALMYFSWYAGWQNSFNKGYEDAWVGPATGLGGIALWIAAMMYTPMAQARLASAGEWKRFFEFRLVTHLIKRVWLGNLILSMAYSILAIPWILSWLIPGFLPQIKPSLGQASPEQVTQILKQIQWGSALVLVPALMGLRWFAARWYASALLDGVRSGAVAEGDLAPLEWRTFNTLNLLRFTPQNVRPQWQQRLLNVGHGVGRFVAGTAAVLVWFLVIGQVYIAQFMVYRGGWGWLNHPLIQLPWF